MNSRSLASFLVAIVFASAFAQGTKHPFGFDDIASLPEATPVALSPSGVVLYVIGHGAPSGTGGIEWHAMGSDGSNDHVVSFPSGFNPIGFTADGDVYGSYTVGKLSQLAIFGFPNIDSKSIPKSMIFLPTGVGQVQISPDGTRFAVVNNPVSAADDSAVKTVIQPDESSLYVVGIDGKGGKWWAPDMTQVQQVAWSPDSKSIAVISSNPKIGFHYVKTSIDVVNENGAKRVASIDNAVGGLAWMNDGKDLAFLSTTTSVITPDHVWTVSASGGTPVDRTPKLDVSAMGLTGDAHGHVFVNVDRGVVTEVDQFDGNLLTPAITKPDGGVGGIVTCATTNGPDKVVVSVFDPSHPGNVAVQDGNSYKMLTDVGEDQLAKIDFGPVKVIHWTSKEGIKLEGIATFPAGYVEGQKYPFIVVPHGGPEGNDLLDIDGFSRFFAGLGYVVIEPEYRGSTGYGSDFLNAIYQHFGDRAYRDVDSATDYAIAQGWADPNRLAIMGWSAGGFMTSWTVTQTHRYKAAIEGAGITDWGSFIWTSDVQQIDYDARWPGKEPQFFRQFSAVDFADQVTTPLLILHGAADRRVPTFQGQEYYEALIANGKTARMVTYPGSGHFPRLWEQRRDLYAEMAAWLKKYNP